MVVDLGRWVICGGSVLSFLRQRGQFVWTFYRPFSSVTHFDKQSLWKVWIHSVVKSSLRFWRGSRQMEHIFTDCVGLLVWYRICLVRKFAFLSRVGNILCCISVLEPLSFPIGGSVLSFLRQRGQLFSFVTHSDKQS